MLLYILKIQEISQAGHVSFVKLKNKCFPVDKFCFCTKANYDLVKPIV